MYRRDPRPYDCEIRLSGPESPWLFLAKKSIDVELAWRAMASRMSEAIGREGTDEPEGQARRFRVDPIATFGRAFELPDALALESRAVRDT
jgi:hypothetical protein